MYAYQSIPAPTPSGDGLSWTRLMSDVPTDPASVFVFLLLAGCFGLIIWAGRDRSGGGGATPPAPIP